jgi:lipopolysaccharide exporter
MVTADTIRGLIATARPELAEAGDETDLVAALGQDGFAALVAALEEELGFELDLEAAPGLGALTESVAAQAREFNARLTKAAGAGLRWVTLARIVIEVSLLGAMVVLARLIPPAAFGVFAVVLIVQELALSLPMEGIGSAIVQRKTIRRAHLEAGMSLSIGVGVTLAVLTLVVAQLVVKPLYDTQTAQMVMLAAPWYLIGALYSVSTSVMRRRLDFTRLSLIELAMNTTRAVASIALAVAGLDVTALVLGNLVGMSCALVLSLIFAPVPRPRWHKQEVRDLLPYGGPAALACVAWTGFRNGDYAIIGARLGAAQAGYYYRGYQLAVEYQKKISVVMAQMAFPVLARTTGADAMFALRNRMVRLLTVVLFPLLGLLVLLAPVVVPWLFGPEWTPAVVPTQILAAGGAATLTIDATGSALQAAGRARAMLGYGVAHFAVYIAVVLVVSAHGLVAVAAGASIVHAAFLVVAYYLMLSGTGVNPFKALADDVGPALMSCAGLIAAGWPTYAGLQHAGVDSPPLVAALVTLAGGMGYIVVLAIAFPAAFRDLMSAVRRIAPDRVTRLARRVMPARPRLRVERGAGV